MARRRRRSYRGTSEMQARAAAAVVAEDYDSSSFSVSLPSHLHLVRFETLRKQSSEIHLSWDGIHQMGRRPDSPHPEPVRRQGGDPP